MSSMARSNINIALRGVWTFSGERRENRENRLVLICRRQRIYGVRPTREHRTTDVQA